MKKIFVSLCLLLVSVANAYDYNQYWKQDHISTPELQFSLYLKNSPVAYLQNIASITVTENSNAKIENVVKFYKHMIGHTQWSKETLDGLSIFETVDPVSTTLFRIAHNPKTNQYSVGAVKMRFLLPSYLELHLLQVQKLTGSSASASTFERLFRRFLPEAQAQGSSGNNFLQNLIGITAPNPTSGSGSTTPGSIITTLTGGGSGSNTSATIGAINNLAGSLNNTSTAVTGITPGVNALPGALNGTTTAINGVAPGINALPGSINGASSAIRGVTPGINALPGAINNGANSVTTLSTSINAASSSVTQVSQSLSTTVNGATQSLSTTVNGATQSLTKNVNTLANTGTTVGNDVKQASSTLANGMDKASGQIASTFSVKNAAEMAGAATLSGILVGATATVIASGTWEMAKRAYHELTGTFTDEQINDRLNRFQSGMKSFADESPRLIASEQKLTMLTTAMSATTNQTTEQTLAELDREIAAAKSVAADHEAAPMCVIQAEESAKNLEDLRKLAASSGVCQQLDGLYTTWVEAEGAAALARKNIIQNYKVFMGVNSQQAFADTTMQERRKQDNACETTSSKLSSAKSAAKNKDCSGKDKFSAECRSVEALQGIADACGNDVEYSDDSQSTLTASVRDLNSQVANFAGTLAKLDCSERDANKSCTKPGPVVQSQMEIKNKMAEVAKSCPNQTFAKNFVKPADRSPSSLDEGANEAEPARPGLLTRIKNFFKRIFTASPQQPVNQFTMDELYRG